MKKSDKPFPIVVHVQDATSLVASTEPTSLDFFNAVALKMRQVMVPVEPELVQRHKATLDRYLLETTHPDHVLKLTQSKAKLAAQSSPMLQFEDALDAMHDLVDPVRNEVYNRLIFDLETLCEAAFNGKSAAGWRKQLVKAFFTPDREFNLTTTQEAAQTLADQVLKAVIATKKRFPGTGRAVTD